MPTPSSKRARGAADTGDHSAKRAHMVEAAGGARDDDHDELQRVLASFVPACSGDAISARFDAIASALLSNYHVWICGGAPATRTAYEILEIEFYFEKPGCHEDPFTHGSAEQERGAQWYFHRASQDGHQNSSSTGAGGYRGGTRKGVDFTLGTTLPANFGRLASFRGGALLRTLRRCDDQTVISGPSLIVDEILRLSGASSVHELVSVTWKGDISALSAARQRRSAAPCMKLRRRPASASPSVRVFRSPRVGLDLSHAECRATPAHPRVVFVSKPYRYFTHPELLVANGRCQTFIGLYIALVEDGTHQPRSLKFRRELVRLMGIKPATLTRYMSQYSLGIQEGSLENYVGAKGKGVASSASAYLMMMGALAKMQQPSP